MAESIHICVGELDPLLVQEMAWRLTRAKPLTELMLIRDQIDPQKQTPVKFE